MPRTRLLGPVFPLMWYSIGRVPGVLSLKTLPITERCRYLSPEDGSVKQNRTGVISCAKATPLS
jgi:hypothetical protein